MKKIPIILTLTLLLGTTGFAIPANAAIKHRDHIWWSVQELLDFYPEVEAEKEAECGGSEECKMEFTFSMYERGPKYAALEMLTQGQIWVTSVNPATDTLKVLFFDEDMMMKHMGITEHLTLEYLMLDWFDEWNTVGRYAYGTEAGMHLFYEKSGDELSNIIPWTESELSVPGSELASNPSGLIGYSAFADQFNVQGSFDFQACIRADDYEFGEECKMYISDVEGISFFPPREEYIEENEQTTDDELSISDDNEPSTPDGNQPITDDEPSTSDEDELIEEIPATPDEDQIIDDGTTTSDDADPVNDTNDDEQEIKEESDTQPQATDTGVEPETASPISIETTDADTNTNTDTDTDTNTDKGSIIENIAQATTPIVMNAKAESLPQFTSIIPKAPNTGKLTQEKAGNQEIILPVIVILGIMLTFWWFIPSKSEKSRKKYKKSIDKKYKLR